MRKASSVAAALLMAFSVLSLSLLLAGPAQAATPTKSILPFMNCYWDNGNGTYTVSIGYKNSNSTTQTVALGSTNMFTYGNPNRGQPTKFLTGTRDNVFVMTASAADVSNGLNWSLTGNVVSIQTPVKCATKPVPQVGSLRALGLSVLVLVLLGLTTLFYLDRRHEVPA